MTHANANSPQTPTPQQNPQNQQQNVGCLLGGGIFVMPYIFAWFTLRKGYSTAARVISFGWMVLVVGAAIAGPTSGGDFSSGGPSTASAASSTPSQADREYVDISCRKMVKRFGPNSKLSDLQKEKAWPKYQGKAFSWDLEIVEVSEEMFGGFQVQAKCKDSNSFIQDLAIKYGDDYEDYVLGLEKGAVYELSGTFDTYTAMTGPIADGFAK